MLLKPQNKTPKALYALGILFCGGDGRLEKYTQTTSLCLLFLENQIY